MFTNKDGYVEGGKEIEMTNPSETQEEEVQGQGNILAEKKEKLSGINMWLSALKIAAQAGSKIYANRQKAKMAMSEAQLLHAERQARGEEAYQGKLLEARQSDWKDEFVLIILSAPIIVLAWAVLSDDPEAMEKVKLFFEYFSTLPSWFTNLWILVVASIFGIKGTQIFRNGGKIMANRLYNKQVSPKKYGWWPCEKKMGGGMTRKMYSKGSNGNGNGKQFGASDGVITIIMRKKR